MSENKLVQYSSNGVAFLTKAVSDTLKSYFQAKRELETQEKAFREQVLSVMKSEQIQTAWVDGFTISQVIPKDTVIFDTNGFLTNESETLVLEFATTETVDKGFDLEAFKKDYPLLYDMYIVKETRQVVDEKRLKKSVPLIYEKYTSVVKTDKEITLRIVEEKNK